MPTCLVVQHLANEGPHLLGDDLVAGGLELDVCRADLGALPALDGYAAVVVMGGPQAAYSDSGFPSRLAEIALLREALARDVPVLGVCLGAQLLAVAAGGTAFRGTQGPEIGWSRVDVPASADPLLGGPAERLEVLQWHADTFTLPPGAERLASSARYDQAFRVGRAWGVQFHPEVSADVVRAWVGTFGDEAIRAGVDTGALAAASPAAVDVLAPWRRRLGVRFAALAT